MNAPSGPSPSTNSRRPRGPISKTCQRIDVTEQGRCLCYEAVESILQVLVRIDIYEHHSTLRGFLGMVEKMFNMGYLEEVKAGRRSDVSVEWVVTVRSLNRHPWFLHNSAVLIEDFVQWCAWNASVVLCDENLAWALQNSMQFSLWACSYCTIGLYQGWCPVISGHDPQWFVRHFDSVETQTLICADSAKQINRMHIESSFRSYCQAISTMVDDTQD